MRINWTNLGTVASAIVLVGAMVLALAFATGWALGGLLGIGEYGTYFLEAMFSLIALAGIYAFSRMALAAEPVFEREG